VSLLLAMPAGKAQSAYLDHVTPDEEMDHNLLILTSKSLGRWVVSTRWSTESPELYDRAVIVGLLKFLTTDGNEFEGHNRYSYNATSRSYVINQDLP
jgi:hypothetical protein